MNPHSLRDKTGTVNMVVKERGFPCKDVIDACDIVAEEISVRISGRIVQIRGNAIIPDDESEVDPFSKIAAGLQDIQHTSYTATIDALNMQLVNKTRHRAVQNLKAIRSNVLLSPQAQDLLIPYMRDGL